MNKLVLMILGMVLFCDNASAGQDDFSPTRRVTRSMTKRLQNNLSGIAAELGQDVRGASRAPIHIDTEIKSIAVDVEKCQQILGDTAFEGIVHSEFVDQLNKSIENLASMNHGNSRNFNSQKNEIFSETAGDLEAHLQELEKAFEGNDEVLEQIEVVYAANEVLKNARGRSIDPYLVATVLTEMTCLLDIMQKGLTVKLLVGSSDDFSRNKSYLKYAILASVPVLALIGVGNYMHWWIVVPDMTFAKLAEHFVEYL